MKNCSRCGELLPLEAFYFVSRKRGTRRGQCKPCMREVKREQRDPEWRPSCTQCGSERPRVGPGRRLCQSCFNYLYEGERATRGSHHLRLNDCPNCGAPRLRKDHVKGTSLCPTCRSVPQARRKRLALYNLTPAEEQALLELQLGVCAGCGRRPRGKSLSIDHQHRDPAIVRGAICASCNTILGLARDRPDILSALARYLVDPPAQRLFPGKVAVPGANRSPNWFKNPLRDPLRVRRLTRTSHGKGKQQ